MNSYAEIADEYYNATLHPTTAALRTLSVAGLRQLLGDVADATRGTTIEIGCGQSCLAEIGEMRTEPILVDRFSGMLGHSSKSGRSVVGDAEHLPVRPSSIKLVVSVLGDPYNGPALWAEVARVLTDGGSVIFTTPSHQWSTAYRQTEGSPSNVSRFVDRVGRIIDLPSRVATIDDQESTFKHSGLQIDHRIGLRTDALTEIPPKLRGYDFPVVTCWLLRKTAR